MKPHKIKLAWYRHREAIIIIGCFIVLSIMLMGVGLWVIENYPFLSLFSVLFLIGGFILSRLKKEINQ